MSTSISLIYLIAASLMIGGCATKQKNVEPMSSDFSSYPGLKSVIEADFGRDVNMDFLVRIEPSPTGKESNLVHVSIAKIRSPLAAQYWTATYRKERLNWILVRKVLEHVS